MLFIVTLFAKADQITVDQRKFGIILIRFYMMNFLSRARPPVSFADLALVAVTL